jgi:preprotein translocase subunit SecE
MGRLLRKKSPIKKRKKTENGSVSTLQAANGGDVANKPVSVAYPNDTRKKGTGNLLRAKFLAPPAKGTSGTHTKNYLGKGLQFLREVRAELKKVTWPSRKQTIGSTVVVIVVVMIISFFLGIVDVGLSGLVRMVL